MNLYKEINIEKIEQIEKNNKEKAKKNKLIEETTEYKKIINEFKSKSRFARGARSPFAGFKAYERELEQRIFLRKVGVKIPDYDIETLKIECDKKLEEIGYQKLEPVLYEEKAKIDNYIIKLYSEYLCSVFGHEYIRDLDGEIEYIEEGREYPIYTDEYYEDERDLEYEGSDGTCYTHCKYCRETIEEQKIFPHDYIESQKINLINENSRKKQKRLKNN